MNHIKLFEEVAIHPRDFPLDGNKLWKKEVEIINNYVGDFLYDYGYSIIVDDGYYYIKGGGSVNKFDHFNELRDYIIFEYYLSLSPRELNEIPDFLGDVIQLVYSKILDPSFDGTFLVKGVVGNNHVSLLKVLLLNKKINLDRCLEIASDDGQLEMVKILLKDPRVDPSDDNNNSIRRASKNGHLEIVKLLLQDPRVDPSDGNNYSIKAASENGHIKIVRLLLKDPRVDPSDDNNYALEKAYDKSDRRDPDKIGYIDIVKVLFRNKRVRNKMSHYEISLWGDRIKSLLEEPEKKPVWHGNWRHGPGLF